MLNLILDITARMTYGYIQLLQEAISEYFHERMLVEFEGFPDVGTPLPPILRDINRA